MPWREFRAFKRPSRANGSWSLQLPFNIFSKHFLKNGSTHLSIVPPVSISWMRRVIACKRDAPSTWGGWKSHTSRPGFRILNRSAYDNGVLKSTPFIVFSNCSFSLLPVSGTWAWYRLFNQTMEASRSGCALAWTWGLVQLINHVSQFEPLKKGKLVLLELEKLLVVNRNTWFALLLKSILYIVSNSEYLQPRVPARRSPWRTSSSLLSIQRLGRRRLHPLSKQFHAS